MKKAVLFISLISSLASFHIESCPTCLGRVEKDSPPFFTDEFYKPTAESMDYIYQQLLAEQESEQDAGDNS